MRIAVWHNLPSGGGKRALYNHVAGLLERGHKVEVWCPPTADSQFLALGDLVPEHVVDIAWPTTARRSDKWQVTLAMERSLAAMDAHCRACAAQIVAGGFDVLFANSCAFFRTTAIGRFCGLPSVLYLQEPYRWLYEALPRLPWRALPRSAGLREQFVDWRNLRNNRLQARAEAENAGAFDRLLVNSHFSRESVLRAYGLDSEVCYLGIDTRHFSPGELPKGDHVVGLGSITPEKNLRFCIEAVARTTPPHPKLVWIGNMAIPSYLEEMRDFASSCGVTFEPKVRISDGELLEILRRALAMVYAPRLEPFGLAPLEANACGTPVVAVAEGGVRETIVDGVNGWLVGNQAAEMGGAIQRLRDNPALASRLGDSARRAVETRWSLDAASDRLERHLERVCAAARAPALRGTIDAGGKLRAIGLEPLGARAVADAQAST